LLLQFLDNTKIPDDDLSSAQKSQSLPNLQWSNSSQPSSASTFHHLFGDKTGQTPKPQQELQDTVLQTQPTKGTPKQSKQDPTGSVKATHAQPYPTLQDTTKEPKQSTKDPTGSIRGTYAQPYPTSQDTTKQPKQSKKDPTGSVKATRAQPYPTLQDTTKEPKQSTKDPKGSVKATHAQLNMTSQDTTKQPKRQPPDVPYQSPRSTKKPTSSKERYSLPKQPVLSQKSQPSKKPPESRI